MDRNRFGDILHTLPANGIFAPFWIINISQYLYLSYDE